MYKCKIYSLLFTGLPGRVQLDRSRHPRTEMLRIRDPQPRTLATVFISKTRTYYPRMQGRESHRRAAIYTKGSSLEQRLPGASSRPASNLRQEKYFGDRRIQTGTLCGQLGQNCREYLRNYREIRHIHRVQSQQHLFLFNSVKMKCNRLNFLVT